MSNARNIANLPNGDDAPIYACRAWVNFDGATNTAGFCTIRASGNVSTVADNGTGDYTVNFATAMPDVNYVCIQGAANAGGADGNRMGRWQTFSQTTSGFRLQVCGITAYFDPADAHNIHVTFFR